MKNSYMMSTLTFMSECYGVRNFSDTKPWLEWGLAFVLYNFAQISVIRFALGITMNSFFRHLCIYAIYYYGYFYLGSHNLFLFVNIGQSLQNTTPSVRPMGTAPYDRESLYLFGSQILSPSTHIFPLGTFPFWWDQPSQGSVFKIYGGILSPGRPVELKQIFGNTVEQGYFKPGK